MNADKKNERRKNSGLIRWYHSRDLRSKMLLITLPVTLVALILIATLSISYIDHSVTSTLQQSLGETATLTGKRVTDFVNKYENLVYEISDWTGMVGMEDVQLEKMAAIAERNGFEAMIVGDKNGIGLKGQDYSQTEFFLKTKELQDTNVLYGQFSQKLGTNVIIISAPVMREGKFDGFISALLDQSLIADLMKDVTIGENGNAFIISDLQTCVSHSDEALIGYTKEDVEALIVQDSKYQTLESLWSRMQQGETGFDEYDYIDGRRMAAFKPIPDTPGWSICISVLKSDFFGEATQASIVIGIVAALFLIIVAIILTRFTGSITSRISTVTERLEKLAEGDLSSPVRQAVYPDEIGRLADATYKMAEEVTGLINETKDVLAEMARGNLGAKITTQYPGDFEEIPEAFERNQATLGNMILKISRASEEVARGSSQMASAAAGLSQGASEQASSIEELFSTISEIAQWASNIASPKIDTLWDEDDLEAEENMTADELAEKKENTAKTKMEKLFAAMNRISENSKQIKTIASSVESIASETNILALNASVEAAHAGDAGRGFNVIASEIRQLAAKSKEAVNVTNAQTERIIRAVDRGSHMVDDTVESVSSIVIALEQIKNTLAQISNVIESTVATAEESAASSEELSAQAGLLREVISQFHYSDEL